MRQHDRTMQTHHDHDASCNHRSPNTSRTDERVKEPVCGMMVDPARTKHRTSHGERDLFFCSARCLEKFRASPESYALQRAQESAAGAPTTAPEAATSDAEYTCPMHPEIVQVGPGTCPKCGMALEPRVATMEEHDHGELADMRRRFFVSLLLTLPLFILAMGDVLPGDPLGHLLAGRTMALIELALATPVVV